MAKSHGYYLQHAKEVCLVGKRGRDPPCMAGRGGQGVGSDVIFSERRGQSQKPEEIYQLIEELVPGGVCGGRRKCEVWIDGIPILELYIVDKLGFASQVSSQP